MKFRPLLAAATVLIAPLAGCSLTESTDAAGDTTGPITVDSSPDACRLSATSAPSGPVSFRVRNSGSTVTEFYVYAADGLHVVGEVENIGPGLTRDLVLTAAPGRYVTACKPGMSGQGIRAPFTVSDSGRHLGISGVDRSAIDKALAQYQAYVKDQTDQLLPLTRAFAAAYRSGDDVRARALYPKARFHYEAIEPVAESFGDLDPLTDLREADLAPGQKWTGWHRIEKDLWPPRTGYTALSGSRRAAYAADLVANITTLHTRVQRLTYTVDQIANGAKGLLDEVAKSKITGEEDVWSHTDLSDFQANVAGAKVAYEVLRGLLVVKDPALSRTLATRFQALQRILDGYRSGSGFVSYDTVDQARRQELSDAVNALSEPLSQVAGALTL